MGYWGKVLGGVAGLVMGGPFGAVMGAALGHAADEGAIPRMRMRARLGLNPARWPPCSAAGTSCSPSAWWCCRPSSPNATGRWCAPRSTPSSASSASRPTPRATSAACSTRPATAATGSSPIARQLGDAFADTPRRAGGRAGRAVRHRPRGQGGERARDGFPAARARGVRPRYPGLGPRARRRPALPAGADGRRLRRARRRAHRHRR